MKLFSPGFPPRRPGGLVRYIVVAALLVMVFYSFSGSSQDSLQPLDKSRTRPAGSEAPPAPGSDRFPATGADAGDKAVSPGATTEKSSTDSQARPDADSPSKENAAPPPKEKIDPLKQDGAKEHPPTIDSSSGPVDVHPITKLIYDAQLNFAEMASKESKTVQEAAQAYRKRRGRHPPPGFDKWFEFTRNNSGIVVEDFFDQIYHDLAPFWGVDSAVMRKESDDFEMTIRVRNGVATAGSDWFWTKIWLNLTKTVEHLLPDMDIALNAMDEPRIVTPYEDIAVYMQKAADTVKLGKAKDVITEFQKLPDPGKTAPDITARPKNFEKTAPFWDIARRGCAPDSPARKEALQTSFAGPPKIDMSFADPHSFKGFVSNYTLSGELCHQPDLQGLEGILIAPLSTSSTKVFFPMFGGSKLSVNNEILLPAPMYWNEEERFTGGDDHGISWAEKKNSAIWRGVATGGLNKADNWRGFQRHRFVSMNNGTQVSVVESGRDKAQNFALPEKQYGLKAQEAGKLGEWVNEWTDVAFIDLSCSPNKDDLKKTNEEDKLCDYVAPYFHTEKGMKMAEQFDHKFLPDIDGNSFSGRYLGFLRSTSLPVKSTIWREWHDSRLIPWKHFVPMDNRFGDYYGIMEYFLGYQGRDGHDAAAEKIATEGKEWAEQVLRKEDMQIYVLRLLLEYGRLLDSRREDMGYVEDVLKEPMLAKIWGSWW